MMNKVCIGLIRKSFQRASKHLTITNSQLFASSKYQKPNKPQQNKTAQTTSNQLLKSTPNTLNTNKPNNKPTTPQQSSQYNKGILTEQQRKQLAFQQKLQATYTELQSFPSDSYQTVVENFKRIKERLNDRKVYIPDKPLLLAQLDTSMQLIRKHHNVWRAPSTNIERSLGDSKKEIIQWELEQAKKKYYLSLLENEKVLIGGAVGVVMLVAWLEYYFFVREAEDPSLRAPKMFL